VYRSLRMFAFFEMLLFIVLVLAGFFYVWRKGALDWTTGQAMRPVSKAQ
jgi:NADH-quinone oxidoreductase subunit A